MINSFKSFLVEEEKSVYFTFGRMNPPTTGHEKLFNALAAKAGRNPYRIFVSQSQDAKKNPLAYKDKVKAIRKMFPKHARSVMVNNNVKNAMNAASELYKEGYKTLVMVVGSDRVREFSTLLDKYNGQKGRHGFYNFTRINVVSAGDRDPDAEGVEGMSASKMRGAAASGDFTKFSQGVPRNVSNAETKAIYNMVRKGMGLKETNEYTKHIQLKPVSDVRESYVNGELFKEGDEVVIKDTGELAKVKSLGSNYVIVEGSGNTYRKWLDAIEPIEAESRVDEQDKSRQDPDIKDRKGSQPAAYHKGLSKSTKTKRDAQFKKQSKMADDNPAAYKPAPGDATGKTKPSKHTKKFKDMYGEQTVAQARARISREREIERRRDAADKKRHDSILDRARTLRTRKINRGTTSA